MTPLWDRRIARAAVLKERIPSAAALLAFYEKIATFQNNVPGDHSPLLDYVEPLLLLVEREGPPLLAESATGLRRNPAGWPALLDTQTAEPTHAFFARVLRQPCAAHAARRSFPLPAATRPTCPFCDERPVAAVLKVEGEGGKRHLLCSLCLTEWEFRRLLCPNCGEESEDRLPVYKAREFPHIRIEACDSCRHYIKSVDLTIDGHAVADVDDLASPSLDLWASEMNYTKIRPNLLGY